MLKGKSVKYANMIGDTFENPVSFLSGLCSVAEAQIKTGNTDREAYDWQKLLPATCGRSFYIFTN